MATVNKRAYSSPVREEQAALTRARILDAAGDLFVSNGFARTTIRRIAETAQVSPDTVYAVFGSKARVLTALIDQRLAPASYVENVLDRPEATAVRDETDQRRQIRQFARDMASISTRVRPVYEILRTASAAEPAMAAIRAEMDDYRLRNMRQAAQWIAARGPLRIDVERAGEIIWTVASPDVSRMLCDDLGWTQDEYADWLEDTLVSALLPVDDQ
ncbi:MAG TPA: TetR/AcrR family transcriptional regulator [Acidimicrobiales bacterium]|nr:TetR/AcrR family transcriptional regulator [Acidimicrobiales bacterium]